MILLGLALLAIVLPPQPIAAGGGGGGAVSWVGPPPAMPMPPEPLADDMLAEDIAAELLGILSPLRHAEISAVVLIASRKRKR